MFCDRKFCVVPHHRLSCEPPFSQLEDQLFNDAVETLQQLKTTFSPLEKLLVIRRTFEQMTRVSFISSCLPCLLFIVFYIRVSLFVDLQCFHLSRGVQFCILLWHFFRQLLKIYKSYLYFGVVLSCHFFFVTLPIFRSTNFYSFSGTQKKSIGLLSFFPALWVENQGVTKSALL
jgi:hypothetical protein